MSSNSSSKDANRAEEASSGYAPSAATSGIRVRKGNATLQKVNLNNQKQHFFKIFGMRSFKYSEIKEFINFLGFGQQELAMFLDVNASTVSRWKALDSELGNLRSKNILEVDQIIAKGVRLFTNEENFKIWLTVPNSALGDVKPIKLLANPFTIVSVDNALEALSWGTYL